jgi:hypothetical protein
MIADEFGENTGDIRRTRDRAGFCGNVPRNRAGFLG